MSNEIVELTPIQPTKATRLERDGKVAVLVSYGYGAGWSTWNSDEADSMLFDPDLAHAVLAENQLEMQRIADQKWPDAYKGGLSQLGVEWVTKGEQFEITEYDGSESLNVIGEQKYHIA